MDVERNQRFRELVTSREEREWSPFTMYKIIKSLISTFTRKKDTSSTSSSSPSSSLTSFLEWSEGME